MKTLERQLGDYGQRQRELHGPISPAEVRTRLAESDQIAPVRPLGTMRPATQVRHRRPWLAAVAAAVAILAVLGGVGLLSRGAGFDASSSDAWSRIPYDEAMFGGEVVQDMNSVTVGGPGLVAVGHVEPGWPPSNSEDDPGATAVWTSPDGIDWSRVPDTGAFARGTMNSVTAGGPGLVAVGEDRGVAAVWTSVDGISWSRVPHDEAAFGESDSFAVTMSSVTVGGPGLVAVGHVTSGQGTHSNAAVWTSVDGISWTRIPHNDAIFGMKEVYRCCTTMTSVAAGGPGLVAVGWDWLDDTEQFLARVWTSADGFTWSRVPHSEAVFGSAGMSSVTAGGPGLVAVGSADFGEEPEEEPIPAVWTSVDGVTWSRMTLDGEGTPDATGYGELSGVAAGGPGLVAVGSDFVGRETLPNGAVTWVSVGAVWTSVDGVAWSRVPHDEAVFETAPPRDTSIGSVTVGGPGLVAVGASGIPGVDFDEADAAVWIAGPGS